MTLLEQASLVMIPSGYKEDVVYSVIPQSGAGDLSFTRASNGTRINSAGLVEVVPWNLVQESETFSNVAWNLYQSTITPNTTTAPNGTLTADSLIDNTGNDVHIAYQGIAGIVAGKYTISVYAKASTLSHINLQLYDNAGTFYTSNAFNLSNGTTTGANQSIESVGNGWYRCIFTFTTTLSGTQYIYVMLNNGTSNFYVGTGSGKVFVWGYQTNIGSTAKPYFPTTDRLNVPRLTYQNGGGGCPSLLLEKQSTNSILYSEDFSNANWISQGGASITANQIVSPDGTQNADKLNVDTQAYSYFFQVTGVGLNYYTTSIYAKKGTKNWLYILNTTGAGARGWFNLNTGTVGTVGSGYSATITDAGNGWYRCTLTSTSLDLGTYVGFGFVDSDNTVTPTSTGYGYYWGAQLEASTYPTSYISTTSSSATRVGDDITNTFLQSGGFLGSNKGAMFVSGIPYSLLATVVLNFVLTADNNTTKAFLFDTVGNAIRLRTWDASSNLQTLTSGTITGNYKLCVSWTSSSIKFFVNGSLIGTISQTTYPYTTIKPESTSYSNNIWSQLTFFANNLADADAITLTTL
jgi:hypothetical protein